MRLTGTDPGLARQIAHGLINRPRAQEGGDQSAAHAAAATCDRLYRELSRWVGHDGCHALFTRARAEALTEYPALAQLQLRARSEPYVDGAAGTVRDHGDAATANALESMLVHLVELLSRLVGDEMAARLLERTQTGSERGVALPDGVGET